MPGEQRTDVAIAIEFSPEAERMLEEVASRWAPGHEVSSNPLLDQIVRAADLLRENPSSVSCTVEAGFAARRAACCFARDGICTTRTRAREARS